MHIIRHLHIEPASLGSSESHPPAQENFGEAINQSESSEETGQTLKPKLFPRGYLLALLFESQYYDVDANVSNPSAPSCHIDRRSSTRNRRDDCGGVTIAGTIQPSRPLLLRQRAKAFAARTRPSGLMCRASETSQQRESDEPVNQRVERLRTDTQELDSVIVAPSVSKADFWNLGAEVLSAVHAGADWLHFSVQDGRMVPRISFGSPIIKSVRKRLPDVVFDVKLGVVEPEHRIDEFVRAGADIISIHPESTLHLAACIHKILKSGCAAGVVLNPGTSPSAIEYLLDDLDVVVVMLVNPGWGGPKYLDQAIDKVSTLRCMAEERGLTNLLIEVDGGVNEKTAAELVDAGANVLVVGSSVFASDDKEAAIAKLKNFIPVQYRY